MEDEKELQKLIKELLQEVLGEPAPKLAPKLAPEPAPEPAPASPTPPESEDGLVWVSDGHICVRNPKGLGKFATVTTGPGTRLILNNTATAGTVIVREEDEVHAENIEDEVPGTVKVTVSPNRLIAYLWVELPGIRRYRVLDQEPAVDLVLQTEAEVIKQPVLDEAAVEEELTRKGVVFGIKGEVLKDLLQRPRDGKFIVAEGERPIPPTDETVEIAFPLEPDGQRAYQERGVGVPCGVGSRGRGCGHQAGCRRGARFVGNARRPAGESENRCGDKRERPEGQPAGFAGTS